MQTPFKTLLLASIATLFAVSPRSHGAAAPLQLSSVASKTVPFVIIIDKHEYQTLLDQLPETSIAIDKKGIIENLTTRLRNEEITPKNDQTFEDIASELYDSAILPVLTPRVEKFNNLINKASSKDSVSAGYIAFSGLTKSITAQGSSYSSVLINGDYSYKEGQFEKEGWWRLFNDTTISDSTHFSAYLNAEIDEDITFDLNPYGKKHTFSWNFSCSGKVTIEQKYTCNLPKPLEFTGRPKITLSVTPQANVTASKTISPSSYFSVTGKRHSYKSNTFYHPATLEITVTAKKALKE